MSSRIEQGQGRRKAEDENWGLRRGKGVKEAFVSPAEGG